MSEMMNPNPYESTKIDKAIPRWSYTALWIRVSIGLALLLITLGAVTWLVIPIKPNIDPNLNLHRGPVMDRGPVFERDIDLENEPKANANGANDVNPPSE